MGLGSFFKRDKNEEKSDKSHIDIDINGCDACEKCVIACPNNVLMITDGKSGIRDAQVCKRCRVCVAICPNDCINVN